LKGLKFMQAYIFVNTDPGRPWNVAKKALDIEGVKMAHAVTGQFDVVIYVEFSKIEELGKLIEELHSLNGVLRTQTAIAMPSRVPM